ncbi:MAG: hypothetical protein HY505_01640 [Candidatus Yanofskybacteria bacterium]|nr:hypothetical protein [Candidatus Yanofskybacteria bacterium]
MFNKLLKTSVLIFVGLFLVLPNFVFAGKAEGVEINKFDVQPRTVNVGQNLNFTLNVTVYKTEFDRYCTVLPGGGLIGSDLYWIVGEILSDGRNLNFHPGTGTNIVTYGQLKQRFGSSGVAKIDFSFSKAAVSRQGGDASTPNLPDRKFYAEFSCNRATGSAQITSSNEVPVVVNAGSGCGGPGQPSCSDCGGPGQPSCGSTCGGPGQPTCPGGTCNNNGTCEPPNETIFTCPADCKGKPGEDQVFPFELKNPLLANNLLELIDVLATWLFNLSIPIVVVMIVYAGVMFLTSRGEPARVTKARQILLYAVVGFAIILIGKGFITLIESILNLGAGS